MPSINEKLLIILLIQKRQLIETQRQEKARMRKELKDLEIEIDRLADIINGTPETDRNPTLPFAGQDSEDKDEEEEPDAAARHHYPKKGAIQ